MRCVVDIIKVYPDGNRESYIGLSYQDTPEIINLRLEELKQKLIISEYKTCFRIEYKNHREIRKD
jgi:hypothetical protein